MVRQNPPDPSITDTRSNDSLRGWRCYLSALKPRIMPLISAQPWSGEAKRSAAMIC